MLEMLWRRVPSRDTFVYIVTVLLSAFLLFQVQPMLGKYILPFFGGSSSVWAVSMLFFTLFVFVGYLYVLFLTRYSMALQVKIHTVLLAIGMIFIFGAFLGWGSLFVPLGWVNTVALPPAIEVFLGLFLSIGIPYFLLATTSPLLQFWYGIAEGKEPYMLYLFSNVGSLLALGTYSFFVEPHFPLSNQQVLWSIFFLVFAVMCRRIARAPHLAHHRGNHAQPLFPMIMGNKLDVLFWVAVAAVPAFLLIATTTHITQVVAPVPLFWIIPLLLYLISYIIAFAGRGNGFITPLVLIGFASASYWALTSDGVQITTHALLYLALLFVCSLLCHARLYATRPRVELSPLFYVALSFGGVFGTFMGSVAPPIFFNDYYEFPIGVIIAVIVGLCFLPVRLFGAVNDVQRKIVILFFIGLTLHTAQGYFKEQQSTAYLESSRNFYGAVKVIDYEGYHSLRHGTTLHGLQFIQGSKQEFSPTTYYSYESGVGRALLFAHLAYPNKVSYGVVGLGSGTLAAYCMKNDEVTFYEIDPRMEDVAKENFTFMSKCPQAEVVIGDGRIRLEEELRANTPRQFDVLAIDAFSDDSIPVHLLTEEAFTTFEAHLRTPQSILAIHTSNRYLELAPVVAKIAKAHGYTAFMVHNEGDSPRGVSSSMWVLLAKNKEVFNTRLFAGAGYDMTGMEGVMWTDNYANVFSTMDVKGAISTLFPWLFGKTTE